MSLFDAIRKDDLNLFQQIIQSPDINENQINNALHDAVLYGQVDMVKQLCEKGANVHFLDESKRSPLIYAVHHSIDIIKILLTSCGNEVNQQFYDIASVIDCVCAHEYLDKIELLVNCISDSELLLEYEQNALSKFTPKVKNFFQFCFKKKEIWTLWEL